MTWSPRHLPDQTDRRFVITGGNGGLGYFAAEQLAGAGSTVVLATRSAERADAAIASIRDRVAGARLERLQLDLSSLESARAAGDRIAAFDHVDGLVLNAGMTSGSREREVTDDGHERIFATNYLGHFALAAHAWPALERAEGSRVVGLGSISTLLVTLDAADLQTAHQYSFFRAYALSKHAVHGFVFELDRRLRASTSTVGSLLAHPGFAIDSLSEPRPGIVHGIAAGRAMAFGAQGKNRGAAPIVRALVDPAARSGEFYGPQFGVKGPPVLTRPVPSSSSPAFGRELWRLSEEWTGEAFRP
ncbi:SDR family NAD(P)-dependent oxidoreductase [Marisediminicola senii]|uniref:SDR family NAD(P)-dependent oxidoreductase n=1 Tax=Marisediminicola senii TaxID=2711233 RepID=UPI0013E9B772|nr:SDR family NAD(P)-dependent oxidoreductase [Marisediminicola senii]